ncbi:amidase family protein [Spongiactinospora sp. TRM90649]|uniref:amidase n=1 Tax=Spongiactinospora sp. TRM90649 TaxID=3031114 RepID=UPI0023F83F7F|nr:amidase family protein [Spongiactinospora sp. TRM90649]MDF5756011.1 amidase family protein [Spongiactinospora sp. TRM90649]
MSGVDELCELTAVEAAGLIRGREIASAELVEACLRRIEQVNGQVNAIVTLTAERALDAAARADADLGAGRPWGPLHGLPVAHKDLVDTAGVRTTYGSRLYAEHVPDQDALIVRRMRAAGAISIGKTNTPEFGTGSHTVNEVFGATRNPYDTAKSAGGSSGGAAAALATGMVPLADGSDMGGSLRNPASFCNVAGLRPTPGLVPSPTAGTAAWYTLAVSGPMARTVADLALLLGAMAGFDPASPVTIPGDGSAFTSFRGERGPADGRALAGLRVAWSPDLGGLPVDPETAAVTATAPGVFERLGARVERVDPDLSGADDAFRTYRAWYYALAYGDLPLDELAENVRWNIAAGREVTAADLARAERLRTALFRRMSGFWAQYDVLIAPVSQVPPFPVEQPYVDTVAGVAMPDYLAWMRSAYWISVLHAPAASVPCGFTPGGLPVGVQIVGPPYGDLGVLRAASAFEAATEHGARRPSLPG